MRRAAWVSLTLLLAVSVVGSAAGSTGSRWHVTPDRSLGSRIGAVQDGAVNRLGTSVVVFASHRSITLARRTAHGSRFRVTGRLSGRKLSEQSLTALADGRFLLVYATGRRLVARTIGKSGRFSGRPHVLAKDFAPRTILFFPQVLVDSDPSRAVVVWASTTGTTEQVEGAVDDGAGWSSSQTVYAVQSAPASQLFTAQLVHDGHDRFLLSLHGTNGDTTAVMRGLQQGSRQWQQVTPPQAADGSALASQNGATAASLDGTITAAWQDASGALVLSTWDGSTWTAPVTAVAGSRYADGTPVGISPLLVSDGSRAAIVWMDESKGLSGRDMATIRAGSTGGWSAPVVFPHSLGQVDLGAGLPVRDAFWFTASGALAGAYAGDPIRSAGGGITVVGLWLGRVGGGGASAARAISRNANVDWFVLTRSAGLHTIVWAPYGETEREREYAETATRDGAIRRKQRLPACGAASGVSNPAASAELLLVGGPPNSECPAALVW